MNYFENYEVGYEPSEVDEIVEEATSKILDVVKKISNRKLKDILEENRKLKVENNELKRREIEVRQKENSLEREYKLKLEGLERDFRSKALKDLDNLVIDEHFYGITNKYCKMKKCEHCNDNRSIITVDKFGGEHKVPCKCTDSVCVYNVGVSPFKKVVIRKEKGDKEVECRVLYLKAFDYCSDYHQYEFIEQRDVLDKFTDDCKEMGSSKVAYRTEEEAQKHCDWLNRDTNLENVELTTGK